MTFHTFQTLVIWLCIFLTCFVLWFLIGFGVVAFLESL